MRIAPGDDVVGKAPFGRCEVLAVTDSCVKVYDPMLRAEVWMARSDLTAHHPKGALGF